MRQKVLVMFFAIVASAVMVQAQPMVSGAFELRLGKTQFPIYPRGQGPNQKWQFDVPLAIDSRHWETRFRTTFLGGSIIDNPDQFRFDAALEGKLPLGFRAIATHDDSYALNHEILPDYAARRPVSSVNAWWVGGAWQTGTNRGGRIAVRRAIAGDVSLAYGGTTVPYAVWALDVESWHRSCIGDSGAAMNFFLGNSPGVHTALRVWNRKRLVGRAMVGIEGIAHLNVRMPQRDRFGVFFTLTVPFGTDNPRL